MNLFDAPHPVINGDRQLYGLQYTATKEHLGEIIFELS